MVRLYKLFQVKSIQVRLIELELLQVMSFQHIPINLTGQQQLYSQAQTSLRDHVTPWEHEIKAVQN